MKKILLSLHVKLQFLRYCLLLICTPFFAQQSPTSLKASNAIVNNLITGSNSPIPTERSAINIAENTQYSKTANINGTIEKHRVWINLSNNQGAFKQLLIGYITGATNGWDSNYDGIAPDGNKYVDFYSIDEGRKLSIQGRAVPFNDSDVIQIGYRSAIAGEFVIAIDHTDGDLNNHPIFLTDKKTGLIQDLKSGGLVFTTAIGTFDDRFVVSYGKTTLGTPDFENITSKIIVSVKDKIIRLASKPDTESLNQVVIYDITGKVLYSEREIRSNELEISNIQSANQVLLVKTTLDNDYTTTTKILF